MIIDPEIERLWDEEVNGARISPDASFDAYCKIDAVNVSRAKAIDVSPLAYRHLVTTDKGRDDTDPMRVGRAVHTRVLEPHKWGATPGNTWQGERFTFFSGRRSGKAWELHKETWHDCTTLTESAWSNVEAMARAVFAHPVAAWYLDGSENERNVVWTDEASGLRCKARIDAVTRRGAIVDLKTARSIVPDRFAREVATRGYYVQAAHYVNGAVAAGLFAVAPKFVIIAVESRPPFDVAVYELGTESMEAGRVKMAELLDKIKTHTESGKWPGVAPDLRVIEVPTWALGDLDETFEDTEIEDE